MRYPSLGTSLAGQRREEPLEVRCSLLLGIRAVNPAQKHYVYTNEASVPIIDGVDVETFLTDLDVDVVHLPFDCFDPKDHSRSFRNAFYKLDVLRSLAIADRPSILLDSDVVGVSSQPNSIRYFPKATGSSYRTPTKGVHSRRTEPAQPVDESDGRHFLTD